MRKGITPIISIIVLLLITVSLAGAAYMFLGGYMTGITGRALSVQNPGSCVAGGTAAMTVTNMGNLQVDLGACSPSGDSEVKTCGDVTVAREDGGNISSSARFSSDSIPASRPGQLNSTLFKDPGCGSGNVCVYAFTTPGSQSPVKSTVSCS